MVSDEPDQKRMVGAGVLPGVRMRLPFVIAHGPSVRVVSADAVGVILRRVVLEYSSREQGQQAILATRLSELCRRIDLDQLVAGVHDMQVVEHGAVAALYRDAVLVAVADGQDRQWSRRRRQWR